MTETENPTAEVLYNAECPVCRREIDHYARLNAKKDLNIGFTDLNDADALRGWQIDDKTAAQRLHVRKDGEIYSGIPAFIALWQKMPQYRWLARVVSLPVINRIAVVIYDRILAPLLYRWHLRRTKARQNA